MDCTPELRPLIDWLEASDRVVPCPAAMIPTATRQHLEQYMGPAETYIAFPGSWVAPYGDPEKVYIYPRGFMQDSWVGLTRAELREAFADQPAYVEYPPGDFSPYGAPLPKRD